MGSELKSPSARALLHVMAPLFVGGAIYVALRPTPARFIGLTSTIHFEALVRALFEGARPLRALAPDVLVYTLPDGLFAYAAAWTFRALHPPSARAGLERVAWLLSGAGMCVGWEIGQGLGLIAGTFDWLDLGATIAAIAIVERATIRHGARRLLVAVGTARTH